MSKSYCTGVYQIRNLANGKRYIGSTAKSFSHRWSKHRRDLQRGKHHSPAIQRAWDKYGENAFAFEIVLICSRADCVMYEQRCLDGFKTCNQKYGYNICPTAGSTLGVKHSAEACARKSLLVKGRRHTPETIAKCRAVKTGLTHTPEAKAKMRAAKLGRRHTKEAIAKCRIASANRRHTAESRAKLSAALSGKKKSAEHVAMLVEAWKKRRRKPAPNQPALF